MSCNCGNGTCGGCQPKIPQSQAGAAGKNAYTVLASSFTQPAPSANVTITVSTAGQFTNAWAVPLQTIFIERGGYYSVVATVGVNQITVTNLGLAGNAAPGATIASGGKVSPSGKQGASITGAPGANGILRLFSDTTTYDSPIAGTGTLSLTAPIAANTIDATGKGIRVTMYWRNATTSPNGLATSLGIRFGGQDTCIGLLPGLIPVLNQGGSATGSIVLELVRTGLTTATAYTSCSNIAIANCVYTERLNMTGIDWTIINNIVVRYSQANGFDANVDGFFVDLITI